jgi:hypothetical protein
MTILINVKNGRVKFHCDGCGAERARKSSELPIKPATWTAEGEERFSPDGAAQHFCARCSKKAAPSDRRVEVV